MNNPWVRLSHAHSHCKITTNMLQGYSKCCATTQHSSWTDVTFSSYTQLVKSVSLYFPGRFQAHAQHTPWHLLQTLGRPSQLINNEASIMHQAHKGGDQKLQPQSMMPPHPCNQWEPWSLGTWQEIRRRGWCYYRGSQWVFHPQAYVWPTHLSYLIYLILLIWKDIEWQKDTWG